MNEVVKYHNTLNEIDFKGFTGNDLSLLMAICARMRDLGEEVQEFTYDYVMELIEWDRTQSIDVLHKEIRGMSDKLRKLGGTIEVSSDEFTSFNLFSTFEGNKRKRALKVRVNPDLKYVLNDLTNGFYTKFELQEYVKLDGRYSKLLYQHLKQYKTSGWWKVTVDDIRRTLSIPDSYKVMHIMDKVIKPSISVLKGCKSFSDLDVEVIRSSRRGRAVTGYIFRWTPINGIKGQMRIEEYQEQLDRKKEAEPKNQQKKNSFNNFPQRNYDSDFYKQLEAMQGKKEE